MGEKAEDDAKMMQRWGVYLFQKVFWKGVWTEGGVEMVALCDHVLLSWKTLKGMPDRIYDA